MAPAITNTESTKHDLKFGSNTLEYHVAFNCEGAIATVLSEYMSQYSSILFLIDSGASPHAESLLSQVSSSANVVQIVVDPREEHKRLSHVEELLQQAVAANIQRDSAVVVMGGGVLGNIGGMVASLLFRGLPLVHLPTTPVAAFDSVLSTKQAVNLCMGKNLCGTFLMPSMIACDLSWLRSVPTGLMSTGLVEMAKNVLAVRPDYRHELIRAVKEIESTPGESLNSLFEIGVHSKAPFLVTDPKEKREALVFEYGHTVGHALEFVSAGRLSHGEAVGWGMLAAADISRRFFGLSESDYGAHVDLISALGLDRRTLNTIDRGEAIHAISSDNKRGYLECDTDSVPMVILESLGHPIVIDGRPLVAVPKSVVFDSVMAL